MQDVQICTWTAKWPLTQQIQGVLSRLLLGTNHFVGFYVFIFSEILSFFSGKAQYTCANGGVSWSGILAPGKYFSPNVEVSYGQRQACNSTTNDKQVEIKRTLALDVNSSFCRRSVTPKCDPQYAHTVSIFNPGIYSPHQQDCVNTTSGIFLSGENCTFNQSDPYSNLSSDSIRLQIGLDWMRSNDVDTSTGSQASVYTIPAIKEEQVHLRQQCNCMGGCFDNIFAFYGYLGGF